MNDEHRPDQPRHQGMGAIIHDDGVAFRVWAPHAHHVSVIGDFNGWNAEADPMTTDGEGYGHWYADVASAEPGHEYQYLITTGDQALFRVDPYATQVTSSVGNGVIYDHGSFDWEDDQPCLPFHNEMVIYEAHVGSFAADGEGTASLDDVAERLGHLVHLGVNVIQLMPIAEFAGDVSWGYNPAHIFAVDSGYGGPDAFKRFVKEAHRHGIGVILDVVYNHFGPSDLNLWQFDGWSENGKGGIYFYNDHRSETPWGDTRPDYGRPEVRNFIHDNALMWLREFHVDGLRLDMTTYMRSIHGSGTMDIPEGWDLSRWINTSIREQFPGRITIAEDLQNDPAVTSDGEDGALFDAQWDPRFVHPVRDALTARDDAYRSMSAVAAAIEASYGDAFSRVIYTESHDEVANGKARVPQEVHPDDPTGWHAQKRSTIGAVLTMTTPGIPMLFQGQEFLQGAYFRDDVPMDWHQNEWFQGIVLLYRDLIRLRRNLDGTTRGLTGQHLNVMLADEATNLLVYHRWYEGGPGDDVVVVVNLGHRAEEGVRVPFPRPGRWALRFNSDASIYSADFANTATGDAHADDGAEVTVAPYSALIYSYEG